MAAEQDGEFGNQTEQKIEELRVRASENRRTSKLYDGEKGRWYAGIAKGYENAIEVLQNDEH